MTNVGRVLTRVILGAGIAVGLALSGLAGFTVWVGTGGGNQWLRGQLETRVSDLTEGGSLRVGSLDLNARGLRLGEVVLADADGAPLVQVGTAVADLALPQLLEGRLALPQLSLSGVHVHLTADEDGNLDLVRLFGPPSAPSDDVFTLPVDIVIPDVALEGVTVQYDSPTGTVAHLAGFRGTASFIGSGSTYTLDDVLLSGQLAVPGPIPVIADGRVVYDAVAGLELDDVHVRVPHGSASVTGTVGSEVSLGVQVHELAALALDPFVDATLIAGDWVGAAAVKGPLAALELTATLSGVGKTRGAVVATGAFDLAAEQPTWGVAAQLSKFHLHDAMPGIGGEVVLDGSVQLDGSGVSWPDALQLTGSWSGGHQELYGQTVDAVDAHVSLSGGVLRLEPSQVDGIVGALTLAGEIDLVRGPMGIEIDGELSPERLSDLGIDVGGVGTLSALVHGDWVSGSDLRVDGTVDYARFRYGSDVRAARLVAPFSARIVDGNVQGTANLAGEAVSAYGLVADSVVSRNLAFRVPSSGPQGVTGSIGLSGVAYGALMSAGQADTDLSVLIDGDTLEVAATVGLVDYAMAGRPGTDGTVTVDIQDQIVGFRVALRDYGRSVLEARGRYGMTTSDVRLRQLDWSPTPRSVWTLDRPLQLTVVDGGAADLDLSLTSNLGHVEVTGDLGTSGPVDAAVGISGLQLDLLAELYPDSFDGLAGALDLGLTLTGTGADPVVNAMVELSDFYLAGSVRYVDARGGFSVANRVLTPAIHLDVADEPFAVLTGSVPLAGGLEAPTPDYDQPSELQLTVRAGGLHRLGMLSPSLDGSPLPAGRVSAVVESSGTLRNPDLRVAGILESEVPGWAKLGRVEFDLRREGDTLRWRTDLREDLRKRAYVDGSGVTGLATVFDWLFDGAPEPDLADPELYLTEIDGTVALAGVPLTSLTSMVDLGVDVGGDLVGGFLISGSPMRPVASGAVNWLDAELGGEALTGAFAAIEKTRDGYTVATNVAFEGGGLDINGDVLVDVDLTREWSEWSTGPLDIRISGHGLPLAGLSAFDPEVRKATGEVTLEAHVRGPWDDPDPEFALDLDSGSLTYRSLGLDLTEITLHITGNKEAVQLAELSWVPRPSRRFQNAGFDGSDPRVMISGTSRLEAWVPHDVDAQIALTDGPWILSNDMATVRVNGALALTGDWPAIQLGGALDLPQARVNLDLAALSEAAPLAVDSRMTIHRGVTPWVAREKVIVPPWYADFVVGVDVDLKRNLELDLSLPFVNDFGVLGAAVSRLDLSTRLGGRVSAGLNAGVPVLTGQVELVDGKVRMLNSGFELTSGSIVFNGGDLFEESLLDVDAEMGVEGATLDLAISGTPAKPEISFSSVEYPDKTQQMTMLLTGRAPDELSADEGAGAAQALGGLVFNSLFAGQSLGTFSVEPDGDVRIGVPVSQSLQMASSLNFMADTTENSVSAEAEWSLASHVIAAGGIGDRVQWADVFWEIRF